MTTQTHQQPANELARMRSADEFEVFDIADPTRPSSNGTFATLDEARGCVEFDGLELYEIWQGDHIVEGRDQEGVRSTSGFVERDPGDMSIDEMYGRIPAHDEQILTEQALTESRILTEHSAGGFFDAIRKLRAAFACEACGKSTKCFNVAGRGFRAETPSLASHCSCVGGPAHHLLSCAGSGAEV